MSTNIVEPFHLGLEGNIRLVPKFYTSVQGEVLLTGN